MLPHSRVISSLGSRTGDEVRAAVARLGRPATVLKTEYSAAGFGVRVCDGGAASLVAGAPPYPYPYPYPYPQP